MGVLSQIFIKIDKLKKLDARRILTGAKLSLSSDRKVAHVKTIIDLPTLILNFRLLNPCTKNKVKTVGQDGKV